MIGTTLDKYEITQKIGEGGMATVYRARHATLDREVAVKVLHPHLSASTRNRKRFAREARAIEHLRHENILEILDYSGTDSADCYIVTEFVRGETLSELLHRCQRLPSEVTALVGIELCNALGYAHASGVLHRDVKPDNIMIREDGRVKLMDFGIARFLDESQVTLTGALVGSPAYMSPEQAREDDLDARSDLFSLGTVLFHLVTGTMPFSGAHPGVVLRNIIEGNRPQLTELWPTASATLADVVERLLSVHREDRYANGAEAAAALQATLTEVGIDASEPRWALARFLKEPGAYENELDAFLRVSLLSGARAAMERGDSLVGLRLVNRLLSMEDGNPDAITLLHQFHGLDGDRMERRWLWPVLMTAAALVALPAGWWAVYGEPRQGRAPPELTTDHRAATPDPTIVIAQTATVEGPPEAPAVLTETTPTEPTSLTAPPGAPAIGSPTAAPLGGLVAAVPAAAPPGAPLGIQASANRADLRPVRPVAAPPGPTALAATTPVAASPSGPACVAIRSHAPAEVFVDGKRFASTRDQHCHEIPAGTWTFELRASLYQDNHATLTLQPGQVLDGVWVELERLPAKVRFSGDLSGTCLASVDGAPVGTLGKLSYVVNLDRPERPHEVGLLCGSKQVSRHYDGLTRPEVWFDAAGGP